MKLVEKDSKRFIKGYHTQEHRKSGILRKPAFCSRHSAWLGTGYYFWAEEKFAHQWGIQSKKATGQYDIYVAWICDDNILDSCFNRKGYKLYQKAVENVINILESRGTHIEIAEVNRFLSEHVWPKFNFTGIIYCDLPRNPEYSETRLDPLYYEKRIQYVIFKGWETNIIGFGLFEGAVECT
jgi:hypothetical protein